MGGQNGTSVRSQAEPGKIGVLRAPCCCKCHWTERDRFGAALCIGRSRLCHEVGSALKIRACAKHGDHESEARQEADGATTKECALQTGPAHRGSMLAAPTQADCGRSSKVRLKSTSAHGGDGERVVSVEGDARDVPRGPAMKSSCRSLERGPSTRGAGATCVLSGEAKQNWMHRGEVRWNPPGGTWSEPCRWKLVVTTH